MKEYIPIRIIQSKIDKYLELLLRKKSSSQRLSDAADLGHSLISIIDPRERENIGALINYIDTKVASYSEEIRDIKESLNNLAHKLRKEELQLRNYAKEKGIVLEQAASILNKDFDPNKIAPMLEEEVEAPNVFALGQDNPDSYQFLLQMGFKKYEAIRISSFGDFETAVVTAIHKKSQDYNLTPKK